MRNEISFGGESKKKETSSLERSKKQGEQVGYELGLHK